MDEAVYYTVVREHKAICLCNLSAHRLVERKRGALRWPLGDRDWPTRIWSFDEDLARTLHDDSHQGEGMSHTLQRV